MEKGDRDVGALLMVEHPSHAEVAVFVDAPQQYLTQLKVLSRLSQTWHSNIRFQSFHHITKQPAQCTNSVLVVHPFSLFIQCQKLVMSSAPIGRTVFAAVIDGYCTLMIDDLSLSIISLTFTLAPIIHVYSVLRCSE